MIKIFHAVRDFRDIEHIRRGGGRHFLLSYPFTRNGVWPLLQDLVAKGKCELMIESGAWTNLTAPGFVSFDNYCDFLKDNWEFTVEKSGYFSFEDFARPHKTVSFFREMQDRGFDPMMVDHVWQPATQQLLDCYRDETRVCLTGLVGRSEAFKSYAVPEPPATERVLRRLAKTGQYVGMVPGMNLHLSGVGPQLGRFLELLPAVSSIDSSAWKTLAKVGFLRVWIGEADWPMISLVKSDIDQFQHVLSEMKELELDPQNIDDRKVWTVRQLEKFANLLSVRISRVTKSDSPVGVPANYNVFQDPSLTESALEEKVIQAMKRDTSEINPGSDSKTAVVSFREVVENFSKPMIIRSPVVSLVGSVAVHGKSGNDLDLVIHGPLDEATRKAIEFRLGRALPNELSAIAHFHGEELGGPFTDYAHLYDLALIPRDDQQKVIRMVQKQDDPHMQWPKKAGPQDAVLQIHTRGKSAHWDLRISLGDHLVGWTLFAQKPGEVPDIETAKQAKELYAGYSSEKGNRYFKPILAPAKMQVTGKLRQPTEWLNVDGQVIGEGEIGATSEQKGVIVAVARPLVEFGLQLPHFHEYFMTKDSVWQGPLYMRLLLGRQGETQNENHTPEGQTFWTSHLSKNALPSVLNARSLEKGHMPPLGQSAMPKTLMEVTPSEFHFWNEKTEEEALQTRNALVKSKFFTESNVKLVDGEFRRVVQKSYLYLPENPLAKRSVRYSLSWLFWRGPMQTRTGPSRQVWLLMIDNENTGLDAWELSADPRNSNSAINAIARDFKGKGLLAADQQIKPGEAIDGNVLNETKATPAWIRRQEHGTAEVIEQSDSKVVLRIKDDHLAGDFVLTAEEPGSQIWVLERREKEEKSLFEEPEDDTIEKAGIFSSPGGQFYMADRLAKILPPGKTYVEPFAGGARVFFKREPVETEVLNDRNPDIATAYQVIKALTKEQIARLKAMDWTLTEATFNRLKNSSPEDRSVAWLHKFLYLIPASDGGRGERFDRTETGRVLQVANRVEKFQGRLQGVKIHSLDYEKIIQKYDSPDTVFLLDPPYRGHIPSHPNIIGQNDFDEERFRKVLKGIKGKFVLTYGTKGNLDLSGFHVSKVETRAVTMGGNNEGRTLKTLVAANFEFTWPRQKSEIEKEQVIITNYDTGKLKSVGTQKADKFPGRFRPLKPTEGFTVSTFSEIRDVLGEWATQEDLKNGIAVEPKWNGMRTILTVDKSKPKEEQVSIWFEDSLDERAHILPGVAKEAGEKFDSVILDAEILDKESDGTIKPRSSLARFTGPVKPQNDSGVELQVFRILYRKDNNLFQLTEDEQREELQSFLKESAKNGKLDHFALTERKIARTADELRKAIEWSRSVPGSEGAMLKKLSATYHSTNGQTRDWIKIKSVRRIHAMVIERTPVSGSQNTWVYTAAVGPITETDGFAEKETVRFAGKLWALIGRTGNTNVEAKPGDIIQTTVFELQVNKKPGERRVHWFGPPTVELLRDDLIKPFTVQQIEELASPTEIRKSLEKEGVQRISLFKTTEERYVLGIVLEPNDGKDGSPLDPDSQSDIYSKAEVRQAAHRFMEQFRNVGLMHRVLVNGKVKILESFVVPDGTDGFTITDPAGVKQHIREGTWLLGLRIQDDAMWAKVKANELRGLSIGGSARRVQAKT